MVVEPTLCMSSASMYVSVSIKRLSRGLSLVVCTDLALSLVVCTDSCLLEQVGMKEALHLPLKEGGGVLGADRPLQ